MTRREEFGMDTTDYHSSMDPLYTEGRFFKESSGERDAEYKVGQLMKLCQRHKQSLFQPQKQWRVADVGCGAGSTTVLLFHSLSKSLDGPVFVDGFDIHPFLPTGPVDKIRFFQADFCSEAQTIYDLVVLFDVIEHVRDPLGFLQAVSRKAKLIALHIPLDDSLFCWVRNLIQKKILFPGHILTLSPASAINLLTMSGLRIFDFDYSPAFRAPSSQAGWLQRFLFPLRAFCYWINPYLTYWLLGGVSLMVLAFTPISSQEYHISTSSQSKEHDAV